MAAARLLLLLLGVCSLCSASAEGADEWVKCNTASCTCDGVCLGATLRDRTFELTDNTTSTTKYLLSLCDELPENALPTQNDDPGHPIARLGSRTCEGCEQDPADPANPKPKCAVVRVLGETETCNGMGALSNCTNEDGAQCGMWGRRVPGGGLDIKYDYMYDQGGHNIKDSFVVHVTPTGPEKLGPVTTEGTAWETTFVVPLAELSCGAPGPNEDRPDGECSAVCAASGYTTKPGAEAGDTGDGATTEDCCCEGAQGFFVIAGCCIFMFYMFVGLAIVCEEYFVPALNVLCEKLQMSDDVAGATFMAAGASSPEMFASLIGVLDGSAVGAGTVVGSELFNMLVIVGAVCLGTGSAGLMLDWRPLIREVGFFMGSLFLLIFVLYDEEVQLWEGILLFSSYGGYVIVCAKYQVIVKAICPIKANDTTGGLEEEFLSDKNSTNSGTTSSRQQRVTMDGGMFGFEYGAVLMHGFLFKSSRYYTKIRMSGSKWQRRWFILTDEELRYCKNPLFAGRTSSRSIPIKAATEVKRTTPTEFEIVTPSETFTFKAQKPEMAEAWVEKLQMKVEDIIRESNVQAMTLVADQHQSVDEHPSVLAWPDTSGKKILYICTFPMLLCFYLTIPDVRRARWTNFYPLTMINAVSYLALLAYGMMNFAEKAGCLMGIPEDLMGLTVTAAGTSLPNLFASVLVARQGLGNMAVSNAFGSNTFNIFIALGFPWMIGTLLRPNCREGGMYGDNPGMLEPTRACYHVNRGNIFGSCLILVGVLTLFLLALGMTRMKLTPMIGVGYLIVYGIFIFYLCLSTIDTSWQLPF